MNNDVFNLYKEAYKRGLLITRDYIVISKGEVFDLDGVLLDCVDVYHDKEQHLKVGYYIPDGYKSIRVHFSINMGLNSLTKHFNKICFDIGFLNSDKEYKDVVRYCKLCASYMFSGYTLKPKDELIDFIVTKGMNTNELEYNHNKVRKYYFIDNTLNGEERKRIALISMNKNRSKTKRHKIEEAIEYFIEGNKYISQKDIADFLGISVRTVRMNITPEDKKRIRNRNIELTGFPTMNEWTRSRNIDKIIDAILSLRNEGVKDTAINISKETGIHRVTVSKILKSEEDYFNSL